MEAWLTAYTITNWQPVCDASEAMPFDWWCAIVSQKTSDGDPKQMYGELRGIIMALWKGLRDKNPIVRPLCKLYWDLEHPIPGRTTRLEPMVRGLTRQEEARRLAILDNGRAHFKRHLITAFTDPLTPVGVRNLVIRWARIQYDCWHQFQAPGRLTEAEAAKDAAGESDHFAEMMTQILEQVDGKPPDLE